MKGKTLRVLYDIGKGGPMCILVRYKGWPSIRPYCNPANVVQEKRVADEPLENAVSCPVCEAYRQRLMRFWQGSPQSEYPTGSEGQRA